MDPKSNGLDGSEWVRRPKPSGPLWQNIRNIIYNPAEKTFLGRTSKKWGIVLVFYVIFYICLGVLVMICWGGFLMTLDYKVPKWLLSESLIGTNPGVAHRPRSMNYQSILKSTGPDYPKQMKELLDPYQNKTWYKTLAHCTHNDNFGYGANPCLYIKVNRIYDWLPEYYEDASSLPPDAPEDLKTYISGLPADKKKQVWISCRGESGDLKFEYPWGMGLPSRFYPYKNEPDYLSPLVAVQLATPPTKDVVIRCRAWAKNIIHNRSMKLPSGYTRITIMAN